MSQTISIINHVHKGLDLSRRGDGVFVLRTWSSSGGVVTSTAPLYLTEQEMERLFDDIGRALILTLEEELALMVEGEG